jgi:signal transduction histidine kinase
MSGSSRDRAMVELILHELRTPLTVASGSIAQAADERAGALSPAQRAHLERARRACASLELVVRQLRDWTELVEATPGPETPMGPAITEAVQQAIARTGRGLEAPISIETDARVPIAPRPLAEALHALAAAVLRAAADGTRVAVHAQATDGESRPCRLTIGDTGIEHTGQRLRRRVAGRPGFSLPLARAIIESAGGVVWSHHAGGRLAGIGIELPARDSRGLQLQFCPTPGSTSDCTTAPVFASSEYSVTVPFAKTRPW